MSNLPQPTRLSIAVYGALAALALGSVTSQTTAWAQESASNADAGAMGLKADGGLQEALPVSENNALPTFVRSQSMENKGKTFSEFEGEVEVRRHDLVIRADKVEFDQQSSDLKATGNVLINRNGDRFTGPELQLNVETSKGYFEQPEYELLKNGATGNASRIDFIDRDNMVVENGEYSTCERVPGSKWMPDWMIRASSIELDTKEDVGTAKGGVLEFKGVPILGAPYLTFPLSDKRKSGALPPSINIDSTSGFEVSAPYYLNLAPNFDATLVPTVMSKRGVDLGAEFRYLEPSYTGTFKGAYMPSDKLRDTDRWAYSWGHGQYLTGAIGGGSGLGLNLRLNQVSDDNYWRDFPRSLTSLTSRLLPNDVTLGWTRGPWSVGAGAYKWQALQDAEAPFTPPYDRLPVLGVNYEQLGQTILGSPDWDVTLQTNFTRFQRSVDVDGAGLKVGGDRTLMVGGLTRRWQAPGWFVQPAAQLHMTQYQTTGLDGEDDTAASRIVPTVSLDSGLVFERPTQFFGKDYTQTLEPRAFFTWTPYRDQLDLPNYDSGSRDFNLATMFSTNAFNGNDRIADMKAVTLGLNSRLLDPGTGSEVVRLGLAQRYFLTDQNVTLPGGTAVTERISDMLLAARVQWDPLWSFDSTFQYNPKSNTSARSTLGGRYTPGPYRVISAAYRIQRGVSEQVDLGWQWPLAALWGGASEPLPGRALGPNQWYSVGRINYSIPDSKVLDLVAGFEYDAGCWLGRVVMERLQTSTTEANQRVLFQLEFNGLSRLGASSLQTLQANIPRYRYLREEVSPPSRFPQYD
ncbi:LPS biosynthesis protein [Hydrogenophaga crassostreae]|uniref:LPS-assembly protein LptD n=1 Tax=Hydrogenophaga crassostreae TaxID=1763535 RepID=A0A167GCZ0_9BURK|nr:LPS-assembly protein LptD [Hydrogenophaga crassostreae]AOW15191.1 LPS biosynthesis protein [Hydrogenophaga crassostreae]OAD39279.1 LPS biosynthesis protein [Hydrogenophaga crassostreae]